MAFTRSGAGLGGAVLLLASLGGATSPVAAQGLQGTPVVFSSVHGKLETVDVQLNGVVMVSDDGKRMAWHFDKAVIAKLSAFKPGDPVVVIYRQKGEKGKDKAVTALAFPGAAATPVYVNMTGQRVQLVSGPMVNGACGQPAETPPHTTTIPIGGQAETSDACWCCAPADQSCTPANKTGLGRAFLTRCYE